MIKNKHFDYKLVLIFIPLITAILKKRFLSFFNQLLKQKMINLLIELETKKAIFLKSNALGNLGNYRRFFKMTDPDMFSDRDLKSWKFRSLRARIFYNRR